MQLNYISFKIIRAAINVHKELGPGLLEEVLKDGITRVIYTPSESIRALVLDLFKENSVSL